MLKKKITLLSCLFLLIIKGLSQDPKIIDTLQIHDQIKQFGLNEDILNFKEYFFSIFKLNGLVFHSLIIGLTVSICELKTIDFDELNLLEATIFGLS